MTLEAMSVEPSAPIASTSKAPPSIFASVKEYPTIREGSLVIVYLVSWNPESCDVVVLETDREYLISPATRCFPSPYMLARQRILAMVHTATQT